MDARTVVPPSLAGPVRLRPFRASMLQPGLVGDPASSRLFARPWRGVGGRVENWERRRRLTTDASPAVYVHEYTAEGRTVRGLVGLLDVTNRAEDPGAAAVVPHEEIHPRQSDELADRMAQMGLQPAPIQLVYTAPPELASLVERVTGTAPMRQYADHADQRHRIWPIRTPEDLEALQRSLTDAQLLIADGHHRYAAYLRLRARDPHGGFDAGLAMLVDQATTPLHVGAIHRVLHRVRLDDVAAAARLIGTALEYRPAGVRPEPTGELVVATDGHQWATLKLPRPGDRTVVEMLHERLIPALPRGPWGVDHHHTVEAAREALRHRAGVALLVPAPTFHEVLATAAAGHTLPEKATSFQPKPSLGALMRVLRAE
ncbi:DUF1015 family protein [Nocardioides sp. Kera G14]|uniref:DUF1015 family protein n=1 Tax=Nocardioides sp. Kera G14 TaxID=2884264 RepID=UPI001D0F8152|nr:DUF1015 family protein [Nocardioides sp. Kera G14]UDY25276.1 DUF1015 domain-containing protein [Nocardioides sp. Kera G14]